VKTPPEDQALPLTLRFVLIFGICIFIGWFLMFFLLQARA
jgi:hypothetical protein